MKRLLTGLSFLFVCSLLISSGIHAAALGSDPAVTDKKIRNDLFHEASSLPSDTEQEQMRNLSSATIMLYLCGSNLETKNGSATKDLEEIKSSGFNEETVNVIVFAGGSWKWKNEYIPKGTSGIYRIRNGVLEELFNDGEPYNMGDPSTLCSFLTFAHDFFPAEHFALILWDHGEGSIGGVCKDWNFPGDYLDMFELSRALSSSPFNGERKLDWIGFDACLMSSAETARILAPYAGYMIASEEFEPSSSWNYNFLAGIENDTGPDMTGKRIADTYFEYCTRNYSYATVSEYTMACIDLSKISGVAHGINDFFENIDVDQQNFAMFSRLRRETLSYGRRNDYDLVDLGDLMKRFSAYDDSFETSQVVDPLSECVVYSVPTASSCTGLTVYFPFYNKIEADNFLDIHNQLDFSANYERFIRKFAKYLFSDGIETWEDIETGQQIDKDIRTRFMLPLNEEQLWSIGMASIVAIQKVPDKDRWILAAEQEAEIEESGILAGDYVHTNLFVMDESGEPFYDTPIGYTVLENGLYMIRAILEKDGQRDNVKLICSRDPKTYQLTIRDIYLEDEATGGFSPRLTTGLEEYRQILFPVAEREKTYIGNTLLAFEDWTVSDIVYYAWDLTRPLQLSFVKDHLDISTLSVAFKITDIYNNVFMSEPIKLGRTHGDDWSIEYDDDLVRIDNAYMFIDEKQNTARFSVRLTNTTENEYIVIADDVHADDVDVDISEEVYGTGPNFGLLPGESQPLTLNLSGSISETPKMIRFTLAFLNAEAEITGSTFVTAYP